MADNETYYQKLIQVSGIILLEHVEHSVDMFGPAFTSGWRSIGDMFTGDYNPI